MVAGGALVPVTEADAAVYYEPYLCTSPTIAPYQVAPLVVQVAKLHAQDDYVNNANGISVRTCSWKATGNTQATETYKCASTNDSGYSNHAVRRRDDNGYVEDVVTLGSVICDGYYRGVTMPANSQNQHFYDHLHVHHWLSSKTNCADICTWEAPPAGGQPVVFTAGHVTNFVFRYVMP